MILLLLLNKTHGSFLLGGLPDRNISYFSKIAEVKEGIPRNLLI